VDSAIGQIVARFEARSDEIADEIASSTLAEVEGFGPVNDERLFAEIRALARRHLDAFVERTRTGRPLEPAILAAARERARQRAREMVPLHAVLHSYLIAQRVITGVLAGEARTDSRSRGAALALIAKTFDYNIAVTSAMADAYVEVVQGDLAEVDTARRELADALIAADGDAPSALNRRAIGLGFDPEREYVVALAVIETHDQPGRATAAPRWAAQAIARATGAAERNAFVISREQNVLALLDASGKHYPRAVLERAAAAIGQSHKAAFRAGIGTKFRGLPGFSASYQQARRALGYAGGRQRLIFWPADVLLFDELTTARAAHAEELIPPATRHMLGDATLRSTLEAFFAADLSITAAARSLSLHPNSLRYRLRRIAEKTGRDPRRPADAIELIAAARLIPPAEAGDLTTDSASRAPV
jgi:PucR C-terminal helix-turn-helix domain/GGDEF-like domain